jgi:TonB family protein
MNRGKYASVVLQNGDEIFSPELSNDDRLVIPNNLDKSVVKLARNSGFRIQRDKLSLDASPQVIRKDNSTQCPTIAEALSTAARDREQRKREIQSTLHQVGMDGVTRPTAIVAPQPGQNRQATQIGSTTNTADQSKAKHQGTVVLEVVVETGGSIGQVKVLRSLSGYFDNEAIENIKKWKFSPATKDGLPVPVVIDIEVNFRLN